MGWSFRVARMFGIEIRIHFTFLLLLAFYALSGYQRGGAGDGDLRGLGHREAFSSFSGESGCPAGYASIGRA